MILAGCAQESAQETGTAAQQDDDPVVAAYGHYAQHAASWADFSISVEAVALSDEQLEEALATRYDYIIPYLAFYGDGDGELQPEYTSMMPGFELKPERREDMHDVKTYQVTTRIGGEERVHRALLYFSGTHNRTILWDPVVLGVDNHLNATERFLVRPPPSLAAAGTCSNIDDSDIKTQSVLISCKNPEALVGYTTKVKWTKKLQCAKQNGHCTRTGMDFKAEASCTAPSGTLCMDPMISDSSTVAGPSTGTKLTKCEGEGQNRNIGIHGVGSANAVCVNSTATTEHSKITAKVEGSCGGEADSAGHATTGVHYEHDDETVTAKGATLAGSIHQDTSFEKTCGGCES